MLQKFNEVLFLLIEEYISYFSYGKKGKLTDKNIIRLKLLIEKNNKEQKIEKLEQKEFLEYLSLLNDSLSRRGCNDFTFPESFSDQELKEIMKEFHYINGDPECYSETDSFRMTMDFIILYYISHKYKVYFKNLETRNKIKTF